MAFLTIQMDEASKFSIKAIEELKELSQNKIIAPTFITKKENGYLNTLHIFHNKNIVHTQSKVQLFPLGDELEHLLQEMKTILKSSK